MPARRHDDKKEDTAVPVRPTTPTHPAPGPTGLLDLQRAAGNAAVARMVEQQRSSVHDVLRRSGTPLDEPVRQEMEQRLGADFSDVRVHTDAAAQRSAAEIGARAYTSGDHVVIGAGGADGHTLAHELTHVLQQRRGPVEGTDNGNGLRVSDPGDRSEREAESTAARVMSRAPVQRPVAGHDGHRVTGTAVQRMGNTQSTVAVADVSIQEGQVGEVERGGHLRYPEVSSCLTVTVTLRDGGKVGAHISLMQYQGRLTSAQILSVLRDRVGQRRVLRVDVIGAMDFWDPVYLTQPMHEGQQPSADAGNHGAIVAAVREQVGHKAAKYFSQNHEAGDVVV